MGGHRKGSVVAVARVRVRIPGRSPTTRFVFRRVHVPERAPLVGAYAAFENWLLPNMVHDGAPELQTRFHHYMEHGSFGWVTVVAATRFLRAADWPIDEAGYAPAQEIELEACLSHLNDFLLALSLARGDVSIKPVARSELPRLCPVVLETAPMPKGERNAIAYRYPIHEVDPHKYGQNLSIDEMDDAERRAFDLARLIFFGRDPWLQFYELMQRAEGAAYEGRARAAIVDLGGAIEVLLSIAMREGARARGLDASVYAPLLELPLRNQVEHHLGRFVNSTVALDDAANPFGRWWQGGYQLRNDVVREGRRPTRDELRSAFDDARGLIEAIADGLRDPETRNLGERFGRSADGGRNSS